MLLLLIPSTLAQVTVQLLDTTHSVQEGEQFTIRISKTGAITEDLVVVVSIDGDVSQDFVGDTQVGTFTPDTDLVSVTFTVRDDDLAENLETFFFHLTVVGNKAQSSPVIVIESVISTVFDIKVGRDKGTFGRISLTYEVSGTSKSAVAGQDVAPTTGQITFSEGERENVLQLQVSADNIPENSERFIVRLTSATDGASISRGEIEVIVMANDAPIQFEQANYRYDEGPGSKVTSVNIFRGLDKDGVTPLGPIDTEVSADIILVTGTAIFGRDFSGTSSKLTFAPGTIKTNFTFEILDDLDPEVEETFKIQISNLYGDAVWGEPIETLISIGANDNPNGVISFESINGSANSVVRVNEDTFTVATFSIARNGGTFGAVSVQWEIVRHDGSNELVISDVGPKSGTIAFAAGQKSAEMKLTIVQDSSPETAEKFLVQLKPDSVVGNAKVQGIIEAELIIEDSDNVYGTVEFGPDDTNIHKIITDSDRRTLRLQLTRSGGRVDNLVANVSVTFSDAEGLIMADDMLVNTSVEVLMAAGVDPINVDLPLLPTAFLQRGGKFQATISDISLETKPVYGAYNSPTLGSRKQVMLTITNQDANGKIGFFNVSNIEVLEPTGENMEISLPISREGMSGDALIRWTVKGVGDSAAFVTAEDVKELSGTITIRSGSYFAELTITIKPDDVPENDEIMAVTLESVEPIGTQRLHAATKSINITVLENDNPGGVFQFSPEMANNYVVGEDEKAVEVIVERTGGSLMLKEVQYVIEPDQAKEFYGGINVLRFHPGETRRTATILAKSDGIPELNETYTMRLLSYGSSVATIGSKNTILLTIKENDMPYGVLQFKNDPMTVYIKESRGADIQNASLTVQRARGSFGTVSISWSLSPAIGDDLKPTFGTITFLPGVTEVDIELQSIDDDISESDEIIRVELSAATGGAVLGNPTRGTVVIRQNDNPVEFTDDEVPEGNETFTLQLYDLGGDLLQTTKSTATIVIMDNDEAYGVFRFDSPLERNTEEGSIVYMDILREKGTAGTIEVFWRIRSVLSGQILGEKEQFDKSSGSIIFQAQEGKQPLSITPTVDNVPETNLAYKVELYKTQVVFGRNVEGLAKLADANTSVILNVVASDDPNGRFAFPAASRELQIAEDYLPGQESTTRTTFTVERRQGMLGKIEVVWEIYSDSVGGNFPDVIDLMFLGSKPATMSPVPSKQRNQTGTLVLMFSQALENFVTVDDRHKPNISSFENGFTLSAWVQPFPNTNGYIIAKTSTDGSQHYYSLKLASTATSTNFDLTISTSTSPNQILNAQQDINIQDGQWHHILVSVSNISVVFYLDGKVIGNGNVVGENLVDKPGPLLVGARSPGEERFVGYMQDVRLFKRRLEVNEVKEIFEFPARKEITPVSGILTFEENVKQNTFQIQSLQDIEAEGNKVFTVDLIAANGGASLSNSDSAATLTVLKSDNANGLFEYQDLCLPTSTKDENVSIVCSVRRTRGDDGTVVLTWLVKQVLSTGIVVDAVDDFVNYTGNITFPPGITFQTIQFNVKEENIPELEERFNVLLYKVVTDDGVVGTTNTSGASINPTGNTSPIVIEETDYPYGLLQFSTSLTPPVSMTTMILPSTVQPVVKVKEESGMVSLIVERAQGTLGRVTAEWRTEDGTAKSEGKTPTDYMGDADVVVFEDGETWGYVNITINDNNIPEDEKMFNVHLVNPQGGAAVGLGAMLTVVIDSSDGAFGIYRFADNSLVKKVQEEGDLGFNSVYLEVIREGGTIGNASITWVAVGDDNNDLMEKSGTVDFKSGQSSAMLEVKISGDTEPELQEVFQIKLTGTSEGELGNEVKLTSVLTIEGNDDPYGQFVITSTYRPITVEERNNDVTISVRRLKGKFGAVTVNYATVAPTKTYSFLPGPLQRADVTDFRPTDGSLQFLPNQEYGTFQVTIFDDSVPEEDESLFVRLTSVAVSQVAQVDTINNSPTLGSNVSTYAQIIISSNDNANGVIQLSPLNVSVTEGSQPKINVTRSGGLFGEVTVEFRATEGTAKSKVDYEVLRNEVILSSGETSKRLPIEIIDDRIPELKESFTVELVRIKSGGAVLGTNRAAIVNIEPSDDPHGAFGFAASSMSVEEPENGLPYQVNITVERLGGSIGIVTLEWQAKLSGGLASDDITPSSGSLRFISNEGSRRISVSILPDDIPEGQEDVEFSLRIQSTDGRIGDKNNFTLSIAPNDNPHGFVQLYNIEYNVQEKIGETIRLQRSGGSYGSLKVFYTVSQIDLVTEITKQGESVMSYYGNGTTGMRSDTGNIVNFPTSQNPMQACASLCLGLEACVSFQLSSGDNSSMCQWFTTPTNIILAEPTYMIYDKNSEKFQTLQDMQAKTGEDFQPVTEEFIIIQDGETSGVIVLKLIDDTQPELDEKFIIKLTRIEVADNKFTTKEAPVFGMITSATITILANDNANGVFNIYGSSSSVGREIRVEETDKLAVDLIVERQGGSIGDVSVQWTVEANNSTYGKDFIADGAILTFKSGQTRRVITVTILDDPEPEDREIFTIQLTNPSGGATLGLETNISVVILENDYVAGLIGFETTSLLAQEGDDLTVLVKRTEPAHGTVSVDWQIRGRAGLQPDTGFQTSSGSLTFQPGEVSKSIKLSARVDTTPEVNEEYELHLVNLTTTGVGQTGAASADPRFKTLLITIQGSNDPHGVVQFSLTSLKVSIEEDEQTVSLTVNRKFGAIGQIRVNYQVLAGSITPTSDTLKLATVTDDFQGLSSFIDLQSGSSTGTISVNIVNDTIPEIDEVFIVRLTAVTLNGSASNSNPPRLATNGTVSEIIINANDGSKGVIVFAPDSRIVEVNEGSFNISLSVVRQRGKFGEVSVFYFAQSFQEGSTLGVDFKVSPQELRFQANQISHNILVEILNDDQPEPNEQFEVILSNPQNHVEIGAENKATITILANDEPSGSITLAATNDIFLSEPTGNNAVTSKTSLRLLRGPGIYGVVHVPYKVTAVGGGTVTDLSPSNGVVTFQDKQTTATLEISVLDDDTPESEERFIVELLQPDNGATLGTSKQVTLIIQANDSPQGLFEIFVSSTRSSSISVEENTQGFISFDVRRTRGMKGRVSVDVTTEQQTALITSSPRDVTLGHFQSIMGVNVTNWYSYQISGTTYILMMTSLNTNQDLRSLIPEPNTFEPGQSILWRWQGQFKYFQSLETNDAKAATSFVNNGVTYVAIANSGKEKAREIMSDLYKVSDDGKLQRIQRFSTKGASDVEYFTYSNQKYLVFSNSLDNGSQSALTTDIYIWDNTNLKFNSIAVQSIATISVIMKMSSSMVFAEHQRISTHGAVDATFITISETDLLVIANNRQQTISSPQKSVVYKWDRSTTRFLIHQEIETRRVQKVSSFTATDGTVFLAFANGIGNSEILLWNATQSKFTSVWTGETSKDLYPVMINQNSSPLILLASAPVNEQKTTKVYQVARISKQSDFMPRTVTLIFEENETLLTTTAVVLQDDIPEDTETFSVKLTNPVGGAEIGANSSVDISILSNDNAHGIIEFSNESLFVRVTENSQAQLSVVRRQGYFGRVVVRWSTTGDHAPSDIAPVSGRVEFANGQSAATISININDDSLPEFDETTYVKLEEVIETGTNLPSRGAEIGLANKATLIVMANDSPHGVLSWENYATDFRITEPNGTDRTEILTIIREQGTTSEIRVTYVTSAAFSLPERNRATSGADFVSSQGQVVMMEGQIKASVEITIKQDDLPEDDETFLINITNAELTGSNINGDSRPSVKIPGNVMRIVIPENDNAGGLIAFNVTRNPEGRIDVYEEYRKNNTVILNVMRTKGSFGAITVIWQAEQIKATFGKDFYPLSGTISFADGQTSADIEILILDDTLQETMEDFNVKLISARGAELEPMQTVRIAILKNDSPQGLFMFETTQVEIKESISNTDPKGQANLTVKRIQGFEGLVQVQWRLNVEAAGDFLEPHGGRIPFSDGEDKKVIILQSRPDTILEGREEFIVSLTSADNNGDISSTQGDATVVILPDVGASGTISILSDYRTVYIGEAGESSPGYDGRTEIKITRGDGIYGEVQITWSITPRDGQAFLQQEGSVRFVYLQQQASIILQSKDDSLPETRRTYTLQITSASDGATISTDASASTSNIIYVASDYPHGVFEFALPEITNVEEDSSTVTIPVLRNNGLNGQVQVSYTTVPGTALEGTDFFPTSGTLLFENGVNRQSINVNIIPDTDPEGPEMFYVNITSVVLLQPSSNDYSIRDGLQLDMKPVAGQRNIKSIVIEKNDNAEGTLQFDTSASSFIVKEESGMARIPVVRTGGNYGRVKVMYRTQNLTAQIGLDYIASSGEVYFGDGIRNNTINITIRDDTEMEFEEQFKVILTGTDGGALLGSNIESTVTIAKSDYPNGKFGFVGQVDIKLANPVQSEQQVLGIRRTGGLLGQQNVYWQILGPNNPNMVLQDTNDISFDINSVESTQGQLIWKDGESGEKEFKLNIKAYSTWEIEKRFIIQIYRIVGSGEISPDTGNVTLTIEKYGDPNGIIRFDTQAQIESEVQEPTNGNTLKLSFPVTRRIGTGMIGAIKINWIVEGSADVGADVQPSNGSVYLASEQRSGSIVLDILPDDIPELTESFTLKLTSVEGGAELDTVFYSSHFKIRYNDNPHGIFGVLSENQAVLVDAADKSRQISLNFTRHAGTFGSVSLTFTLHYDKQQSGATLQENTGTVTFNNGDASARKLVRILGDGFLDLGSTFTLSLQEVRYIGSGETDPPTLKAGQTEAKIAVPKLAANSKIGFLNTIVSVDEVSNLVVLNLTREGTYGNLDIDWVAGYTENNLESGVSNGEITPSRGTISLPHGTEHKSFTVQVNAKTGLKEIFVVRLPNPPKVSVNGGGQLMAGKTEAKIEPSGVIQFSANSTRPAITELEGKLTLMIERLYGSEGKLQINYETVEHTATKDNDFKHTDVGMVIMDSGQISAVFDIDITQDYQPEREEMFYVNITQVIHFPTTVDKRISPRLSSLFSVSMVTIKQSNDPYGKLSIQPSSISHSEIYTNLTLSVVRSGGLYGTISVTVRTVGGEEPWTDEITPTPASQNNTISNVLANRYSGTRATNGQDYQVLNQELTFTENEKEKEINLTILDDKTSEPGETVLVYLTKPKGGATIATGSQDGGRKGYSIVTIEASDLSNGIIGFAENSKVISADEDNSPNITLELSRSRAIFGEVQVSWQAKKTRDSSETEDSEYLLSQLYKRAGTVVCPPRLDSCTFIVPLINDLEPEEAFTFLVVLTEVGQDAKLDNQSSISTINVGSSDNVRGLIRFAMSSSVVIVSETDKSVELYVERTKGQDYLVSVDYETKQFQNSQVVEAGIQIFPALDGKDFTPESGTLIFQPGSGQNNKIKIELTPLSASTNLLPKQFLVNLKAPSNGASLHQNYSTVTIRIVSEEELLIWRAVTSEQSTELTDENINNLLDSLDIVANDDISTNEMKLIENSLDNIIKEGAKRKLSQNVQKNMKDLFCLLLDPSKNDARSGRHSLIKRLEEFAYTLVTDTECSTTLTSNLISYECSLVKISAGRWTEDQLKNYKYQAQREDEFRIPDTLSGIDDTSQCTDFHLIEYNSAQWFKTEANVQLLNEKIIAFGIKGQPSQTTNTPVTFRIHTKDRRIAAKTAQCVYFDESTNRWTGGDNGICKVTNDLQLAVDSFVDCSCNHMTSYTVIGRTNADGIVGYIIWFYIACFICMTCLAIVILSHHLCSVHPMFAASLLMHMCFAAMATQICIVVAAYLSPTNILVPSLQDNNYRCIVMGLFMHYFFLCQFTWIMTQAFNFWKILIQNDEHTERNYILYFISGWGVPMVMIPVFYTITYVLYKYVYYLPVDFIYGDVNNNGEMCFIKNGYAAVGGAILPILIMLIIVLVVFLRAFQLRPQWQSYDDIYRGRYNITEIQIILGFYIVIVLTWLWGGLHMVYGQLWMLILFCIFNIIQGLMALVLYAILRNPCISCWNRRKSSGYATSSHFDTLPPPKVDYSFRRNHYSTPPVRGSRASLLNQSWEKESIGHKSQMTVKRALPTQVYINPPVAIISPPSHHHHQDSDDKDFEDLLYALKTGGSITPSEISRSIPDDNSSDLSVKLDNFETKRINIADTHL
ncbi:adhesion G-protein coupled receptor V1 [Patella vulgata]|uniref:adhesion G-protein coupled receptor V1 n=1 Tax=Patella vulgata TaxID=6465 RepID=UPI0024A8C6E1|nr:adhesion G-protein coupled receptor V1 [Patella vulgata]